MADDFTAQLNGIASLAEPGRRALYDFVAAQTDPVSREQAAAGAGLPLHSARFHLDRLVDEGLLEVEFRRLTGRTGPGAGRPAKLYRRASRELSVSVPKRQYDLAGQILAMGVDRSVREGVEVSEAVRAAAAAEGRRIAESADAPENGPVGELERTAHVLAGEGYEPRIDDDEMSLSNCPFDSLAREHTELVCGLNLALVDGVVDGLGCTGLENALEPSPGHCCVKTRARRVVA
jgi:predicted ArsR family transcriptional regulator